MTFLTLEENIATTASSDVRNQHAKWEDVNNWEVRICLSVPERSLECRDFTKKEAENYEQFLQTPRSEILGQELPSLD